MDFSQPIRYTEKAFVAGFLAFIFSMVGGHNTQAQEGELYLDVVQDVKQVSIEQVYDLPEAVADTLYAKKSLKRLLLKLQQQGYLGASIDSHRLVSDTFRAWLWTGKRFAWMSLRRGNVGSELLNKAGFQQDNFRGKPISMARYRQFREKLINLLENNGYPFARITLDSLVLSDSTISAALELTKNERITFDTIALRGNSPIAEQYLYNYLSMQPGNLYSQKKIDKIGQRINDLEFISEQQSARVTFTEDKARPVLFLKDQQMSRINLLLGVVPNSNITGRLLITGEADLHFTNPFGRGTLIKLQYEKLEGTTQELNARLNYPYPLGLPFGGDVRLELYKKDTTYLDLQWEVGIEYKLGGGDYIKAFYNNKTTTILNVDTTTVKATRSLPDNVDVNRDLYGLEYQMSQLDDPFIPTEGFRLRLKGGIGVKTVQENNAITELQDPRNPERNLDHLYDSLELKSRHIEAEATFDKFWPISQRSTLLTGVDAAAVFSENLFTNELYRIGGSQVLRGFDEQSIRASLYSVATLEYRFLLTERAYFFSFFDGAFVENRSNQVYRNDFPYGFGVGLTFDSEAGVFRVSYALGSQQGNPIDFRAAKIHFGYVNYF
ncbi:MAG: hypothetical protein BRD50_07230 [Bacteroidetes bacterium SW_11_45_7]|nr:MAG: hypothetical protein BRD50_07230 [Bacteroidetes bacterium SW_11_45_7]